MIDRFIAHGVFGGRRIWPLLGRSVFFGLLQPLYPALIRMNGGNYREEEILQPSRQAGTLMKLVEGCRRLIPGFDQR